MVDFAPVVAERRDRWGRAAVQTSARRDSLSERQAAGNPPSAISTGYGKRRTGFLAAAVIIGFLAGLAYRALVDDPEGKALPNFLRSGLHGVGVGAAAWTVQTALTSPVPGHASAQL